MEKHVLQKQTITLVPVVNNPTPNITTGWMILCGECHVHNCVGFMRKRATPHCRMCKRPFIMCPQRHKYKGPVLCPECTDSEMAKMVGADSELKLLADRCPEAVRLLISYTQ